MVTLANSADPDELPPSGTLNIGLFCLQRQTRSSEKKIKHKMEIKTWDPSI